MMNLHSEYLTICLQSVVGFPASATPSFCQSHLQCQSYGLQGPGSGDSTFRVQLHPDGTDTWAAQSTGALQPQPTPWSAAADSNSSATISPLRQVNKNSVVLVFCLVLSRPLHHKHPPFFCCLRRCNDTVADLHVALSRIEAQPWLATQSQRCPLVRAAYLEVADSLKGFCSQKFLMELSKMVAHDLKGAAEEELQV